MFLLPAYGRADHACSAVAAEKAVAGVENLKPSLTEIVTKVVTAPVAAINYQTRIVSFRLKGGSMLNVKVAPEVTNLKQIEVGDEVTSEVIETMSIFTRNNDGSEPNRKDSETIQVSRPGEKPKKVQVHIEEMVTDVDAIILDTRQINLRLPDGVLQTFFVPSYFKHLDNVKKGDQLVVRHSKTIVTNVTKIGRASAPKAK